VSGPALQPSDPAVALDARGTPVAVWLERAAPRIQGGLGKVVVRAAGAAQSVH
jgi:hypothetical protein